MRIEIEDLFYLYDRDGRTTVALRGLNLAIDSGECLVINGPNGSGKSTLVRILTGFANSSAGRVLYGELDISKIDPVRLRREFVSSIDQKGNLISDLTVNENIYLACSLTTDSESSVKSRTSLLLEKYNLTNLANSYPNDLSASERQMSALAVSLAPNPQILIADEPSGELDDLSAQILYNALAELSGIMTVILVTHDPRAELIADKVVRIRNGRISQSWRHGEAEIDVVDQFGWSHSAPKKAKKNTKRRQKFAVEKRGLTTRLVVSDLGLRFADRQIFSGFNFSVAPGEFMAISGAAGSGKSSLLRVIAGAQPPSKGTVTFEDINLHQLDRKGRAQLRAKSIGYMGQGVDPLENISLGDHLIATGTDSISLLGEVGEYPERSLSEFSGGERARIEILKLLAQGKPLLLLDEPTSQLDEIRTYEIVNKISGYLDKGGAVVASTREPELLKLANSILNL